MTEPWLLVALILAAFAAGFIDSIIGGGGVITLPALLAAGLPPHAAVATNKVLGTGASSIATWNYTRAGLVEPRAWGHAVLAAAAAAVGAAVVLHVEGRLLIWAVMVVMVVLAAYVLMDPRLGTAATRREGLGVLVGTATLAVAAGFYDGMLGPGTGSLLLIGLVLITRMPWLAASANGRIINFGSNVGALVFWVAGGLIVWGLGLWMALGTVAGGWLGSRSNIRSEARWVRPLFVVIVATLFVRLLLG